MRFSLAESGSVFCTRPRGFALLAVLDAELEGTSPDEELVLDFKGVQYVSHSFAAEFVGKAMQRAIRENRPRPVLEGMSAEVQEMVQIALHDLRLTALDAQPPTGFARAARPTSLAPVA
jgi:hypothetical protein